MKTQTMNRSATGNRHGRSRYLLLAMGGVLAVTCHAASYVFTNIADSNGIFAPSGGPVGVGIGTGVLSINNFGTVAFSSQLDDGGSGVFKGNGGPITSIALSSGPVFSLVAGASINATGTVAFVGQLDAGGSGIFAGNGGPTTPVALSSEPAFSSFGPPVINDAGTVAFVANLDFGGIGIVSRNGASTNAIASTGPAFSSFGFGISINSLGNIVFRAISSFSGDGIFAGSGGPVTTIASGAFPPGIAATINDSGTAAFASDSGSTVGTRILMGNGGPVTTFVSNAGPFASFGIYPAINSSGTIAFLAGLDIVNFEVRDGLFTGPDVVADKVLITNEPLFGSTLVSFSGGSDQTLGTIDINDSGQIAFHYRLADGRQGIAVATPVPEPSVAASILVGTGLLWRFKVRRANG